MSGSNNNITKLEYKEALHHLFKERQIKRNSEDTFTQELNIQTSVEPFQLYFEQLVNCSSNYIAI